MSELTGGTSGTKAAPSGWVTVLEEFSTPFPGLYLYYPQRRHVSPALRALIEHLRSTPRQ